MNFNGLKLIACGTLLLLVSCTLNPAWILNPDPLEWDEKRECLKDTPENRAYFIKQYDMLIKRESSGEKSPWPTIWKGILKSLNEGRAKNFSFNTALSQYIIEERRKAGLPKVSVDF